MTTLLIATRNAHKVGEIRAILGAQFQFLTLNDFPAAPKVVEDADTFAGNATKKAVELAQMAGSRNIQLQRFNSQPIFVLADDSGLEVDALERRARRPFRAFRGAGFGEIRQHARRRQQRQAAAPAQKCSAGKTHGAIPLRHRAGAGGAKSAMRNRQPATTNLFDGACEGRILFAPRGKTVSATTRCSCRWI
jgi:inosine/xanthosine triphosphate pyrophosphatase family protein